MTRSFWAVCKAAHVSGRNVMDLPAGLSGAATAAGYLFKLTGGGHNHIWLGGFSLPNHNLIGTGGEGHIHLAISLDGGGHVQRPITPAGQWLQSGDTGYHEHTITLDTNGLPIPDHAIIRWTGPDAEAAQVEAYPGVIHIVELVDGEPDPTPWDAPTKASWDSVILSALGLSLPPQVDRGGRLADLLIKAATGKHYRESDFR